MRSIEVNPDDQKTCLSRYEEAFIASKEEVQATHSVGVAHACLGKCLCSFIKQIDPLKENEAIKKEYIVRYAKKSILRANKIEEKGVNQKKIILKWLSESVFVIKKER